jgi:ATP-dependent DNA helicase RecG
MYASLANRIRSGQQVFVVCPRVEERDDDIASVEREFRRLKTDVFPDVRIAMLHGKMSSEEKQHALEQFKQKETDVLVASSVVEVGVDIAGAAAMLVEGAERFGLAQLHQLRGRVGRRGQHAICYLSATDDTQLAIDRLHVLERSCSGLEIAEADLARRGMGEICGTRQSGDMRFKIARISDITFVLRVRHAAEKHIQEDPELLQSPILQRRVYQITATPRFA